MSDPREFLPASSMFAGMSGLEINAVSAFLEPVRFRSGESVFREGERGRTLYVVRTGRVSAYSVQEDGSIRAIGRYGPGDFFGEMAVIEDAPRSATCVAETDAELMALDALDFYRIVYEHPMLAIRMSSAMVSVMAGWLTENYDVLDQMARWGETARRRAITDSVTGLFNRRFLEEALASRLALMRGGKSRCALMMMDLDAFHGVNERFGLEGGDAALSLAGAMIGSVAEREGASSAAGEPGAVAARLSGDEFALLVSVKDEEGALSMAEELRSSVASLPFEVRSGPSGVTAGARLSLSVGLALAEEEEKPDRLMGRADEALLAAKRAGRNRVVAWKKGGMK
jgi:diguanylate cyclase (GGDEF)-like protein